MCEALTELIHDGEIRGERRGMRKGKRHGKRIGKKLGVEANRLANVRSLMENLDFTPVQAMDALNIPPDARENILQAL